MRRPRLSPAAELFGDGWSRVRGRRAGGGAGGSPGSSEGSLLSGRRAQMARAARGYSAAIFKAIRKGGYVLSDCEGSPKVVLIATGSEVELALKTQEALKAEGIAARVVSMPSTNVFDAQDAAYKASVLPAGVKRVAIEAGVRDGWYKYVGLDGAVLGLDRFGESAPAGVLFKEFGFTVENAVKVVKGVL